MSIRNKPRDAAVFGIDIGKTVFHVVVLDAAHTPIQKATFRAKGAMASVVAAGMWGETKQKCSDGSML